MRRFAPAAVAGVFLTLVAIWCIGNFLQPKAIDFLSFWAAGKIAGPAAYDIAAHAAVEGAARGSPMRGLLSFPYPPPFLLFLWPFGLVSYPAAFALWLVITGGLYAFVTKPAALGHPCVFINGLGGQIAFLTTALFVGGFKLIERNRMLGGAVLGCLIIKPQIAALIPVALLAGRYWRSIFCAAASVVALLVSALLIFGAEAYAGFFAILPIYTNLLSSGSWDWNEVASVFALARYLGLPNLLAITIHCLVGGAAALLVWRAWRRDDPEKLAVVASASLLISPYLFSYDCLLLAVPFLFLLERRPRRALLVWALALSPVLWSFHVYDGPNLLPIAAVTSLLLVRLDGRSAATGEPALAPSDQRGTSGAGPRSTLSEVDVA